MSQEFQLPFNTHDDLMRKLKYSIKEMLNVTEGKRELRVKSIDMPDNERNDDMEAQKNAKIQGISYTKPVYAELELLSEGKVIDSRRVKLLDLPQVTKRGSYIVGGNEYSVPLQKRLIPGVYTREHNDGKISAWLNSSKGRNMHVTLRTGGDFVLEVENNNINLMSVLLGLGVSSDDIRKSWGQEVYERNLKSRGSTNAKLGLEKLYAKLHYVGDAGVVKKDIPHYRNWILNYFQENTSFDPDNTGITLGKKFDSMSVDLLMAATQKVLAVSRGDQDEDNKESLIHNDIFDLSDFVIERINQRQYQSKIKRRIKGGLRNTSKKTIREIYTKDLLQSPVDSTFTQTNLSKLPKQNNPMDTMSAFTELTVMGEGGIQSTHAVTRDVRAIDPSHLGFVDPAHTPEGSNIGTTLHIAKGVKKKGRDLVRGVYNVKTKEKVDLNPRQFFVSHVTFPEFINVTDSTGEKVKMTLKPAEDGLYKVMYRGEIIKVPKEKVQYALRVSTDMFGVNTLAIPFLSHNNGIRVMTASKMQTQAKPLKYREAPLVQSAISERQDETIEQIMGKNSLPKSPVNGVITEIRKGAIVIRDSALGKEHTVGYSHNMWMNENNFENHDLKVAVGDQVKKGQILADSNYTKDGTLALGVNLRTAYMTYKGYNHEDGVVISETAAEKLTSLHAHQKTIPLQDNEIRDKKKFVAYFPAAFDSQQLQSLDEMGIVKVGTKIKKGDPLVAKMRKIDEDTLSKKLQNISRLLAQDYRDTSVLWPKSTVGEVAEVYIRNRDIFIVIKTEEKMKLGDKLVARYGNKGTITTIIPDKDMPKDKDGNAMDIIIDPSTVPGRMNLGQIMETSASQLAEESGNPYIAKPFGGDHTNGILKELKAKGKKDHSTLYDKDGPIDGVLSGKQYFFKLEHQVEKKLSARGAGAQYAYSLSGQPGRGDGKSGRAVGLGELYALLSHGADANLKEMYTFKGDRQLEAWRAIENGTFMPPPEMPASSEKFVNMLKGMGIDLQENDKGVIKMVPFLDRDVKKISNGVIKDATTLRAKDLKEEKGGLFDFKTTGGVIGDKWAHIELAEPMPHPTFEKSILAVTKLKRDELTKIIKGDLGVLNGDVVGGETPGAVHGGKAIKSLLKTIDTEARLSAIKEIAPKKKGTDLNKLHREARVLRNFKDNGIKLEEMVVETIPVMAPKFRPIAELPNGDLSVADVNEHYRATILINNQLKELQGRPGLIDEADKLRGILYDGFKGVTGLSMGIVEKPDVKGIAATISGSSPKYGLYHSQLLKRRQDVSGTAVISPEPKLDMDTIGIPENMAWRIFEPFIIKELKSSGLTSMRAREEIENKTKFARDAMQRAMSDRKVIANRAPTLHKGSMMAFNPKLVPGSAVKLPVEVLGAYNADFDGDSLLDTLYLIYPNGTSKRIHISDFPRGELIEKKGNKEIYSMPDGFSVYAYDQKTHEVRPFSVTQFSVHHNLSMRDVVYSSGRSTEVSDDHSLFCIDFNSLEMGRYRPDDSVGMMSPRPKLLILPESQKSITVKKFDDALGRSLQEEIDINSDLGYFVGAMTGDGWASTSLRGSTYIGFANVEDQIIDKIRDFTVSLGGPEGSVHENHHEFDGHQCFSKKAHFCFPRLALNVAEWIGQGSENKHLPEFWQFGDYDFRLSMLAGLIDTDGSISKAQAKAKKNPQFQCSYTTKSEHLVDDLGMLCSSLGIKWNSTEYERNDNTYYIVTISMPDLVQHDLPILHSKKLEIFKEAQQSEFRFDQKDVVPMPTELVLAIRKFIGSKERSLYAILSKAKKSNKIIRHTALQILEKYDSDDELFQRWKKIVLADNIVWDTVKFVENSGEGITAYDMYVPEALVFMVSNTLIVYDTMGIHVPTTPEAVQEAEKMLPSNNLYAAGKFRNSLSVELGKEYMMGIYKLSRNGKTTSKSFNTLDQALKAAEAKQIKWDDIISVKNIGRTTAGKIRLNQKLPESLKDYQRVLTSKEQEKLFIAVEKEAGKEKLKEVMSDMKEAGRLHVYTSGTSLLLSDLKLLTKERKSLYAAADREAKKIRMNPRLSQKEKDKKLIEIYAKVDSKIMGMSGKLANNDAGSTNNITDMVDSGMSKPGPNQLKQIVGTLGLMLNHKQEVMPEPVRGNYGEGLDSSEFFAHMYAQRKGIIDRSQSVSGPGMLSKELTNSATTQKVVELDCGTKNGKMLPVDKHIVDRLLAETLPDLSRDTVITSDDLAKIQRMKREKVKVRSILTCESHPGVCAKCFGLDETGNFPYIGKNVGVSEIQAITERSVQLPMKSFHSGGVATADKGLANAFDRALQILRMPDNIRGKATLATISGDVTGIKPSGYGGFIVTVNGKDHKVPKDLDLKVKVGSKVKKGDALSSGIIKPQELLDLKGVEAVQENMVNSLHDTFASAGVRLSKRTYEVPTKMLTEQVRVMDPGDHPSFVAGDYTNLAKVEGWNRQNLTKKKIKFKHILPGSQFAPQHTEDWARRMALNRISKTLEDGVSMGFEADRHGPSPFADLVLGPGTKIKK